MAEGYLTGDATAHAGATDVALFMPTLTGGGAERIQLILARYFLAQHLKVDVVVCKRVGSLGDSIPIGARLVSLDAKRVLLSLKRYERYLRKARPRVVISSVENASAVACMARARGSHRHRLVVRQDNALTGAATVWRDPRRWAWLILLSIVYRYADHLIAVSRGVEGQLRRLIGKGGPPIGLVYNPVILPDFATRLHEPSMAARPLCRHPMIVAAGRLHPVKDYPTLLRAFALLRRSIPATLVILGEGDARAELEALAGELGIVHHVEFAGFVSNPLPLIHVADVFVLSSLSEGLGGVLVEALAAGTPVVSTDCRHGPNEVLGGGLYGRLVPVGDVEMLANAMKETLDDPRPLPPVELKAHLTQFSFDFAGRRYMDFLLS
ncbi:D-inositol-3-phosphate glycosyltransferase [Methylobacterium cerastii]|uniref:D-inositol-3-phosphate glycosyltransferase n=1 Tax=Methylobacterium cerastii TaxID=932741 RepID=A0ABQ4QNW2_9HYPH|nr:glycosyltransferase [Methylobacterium cerastii]GJD46963.1 D-inositol-3-phosphate glycosyltransferase [Methylobacterium cerastii]